MPGGPAKQSRSSEAPSCFFFHVLVLGDSGSNPSESLRGQRLRIHLSCGGLAESICKFCFSESYKQDYFTLCHPHHDMSRRIFERIFWHLTYHGIWHLYRHLVWHSICHCFWNAIWHIFCNSSWHIFLTFWPTYLLAFCLTYILTLKSDYIHA